MQALRLVKQADHPKANGGGSRGFRAGLRGLLFGALVCGAMPVQAAGSAQSIGGSGWNILTTDQGCTSYFFGAFFNDQQSVTWSGRCQAGTPISGKGDRKSVV